MASEFDTREAAWQGRPSLFSEKQERERDHLVDSSFSDVN